jgi:methylated-DNA-[protein]-cysteine S-methyltransferase
MKLTLSHIETPTGPMMMLLDDEKRVRLLEWVDHRARMDRLLARHYPKTSFALTEEMPPERYHQAIHAYFAGNLEALEALPVAFGGTAFQQTVWQALQTIPAGKTLSYGQLAAQIDNPKGMRAVGLANGANPIALIVPCHRVIGANGTLTGYGGGMERKHWLLRHEGSLPQNLL